MKLNAREMNYWKQLQIKKNEMKKIERKLKGKLMIEECK
jgi:hypothetical protein